MKIPVQNEQAGIRLDKLLARAIPSLGRSHAKRLFAEGRVRLVGAGQTRGHKASKGDVAAPGDVIDVDFDPEQAAGGAVADPDAALVVLLETPDLVVVEKPAGQPTAPLEPAERGTLANALVARYPEMQNVGFSPREPGLCHRLDTETSGLVLAARSAEAFELLRNALKEGRLDKRYLLVCGARDLPESGAIDIPLAPHPKDRRRVYPCTHPRDIDRYAPRPASTSYKVLSARGRWALVEASAPKASRHQIRAHFAAIDHPLAGDTLYGGEPVEGLRRHALHAHHITWRGDARLPAFCVTSPLPADIESLIPAE